MPNYNDIYMRDALNDSGVIPYSGATASSAPDIIPAQAQVIPAATLIASYGSNPTSTNINAQQNNNIYVRARNLSASPASGTISLYFATSSLILTPNQWVGNVITNASGLSAIPIVDINGNTNLGPNSVGVGGSAFTFIAPQVPQGFHYCLIAQVITAAHPNPIPTTPFTSVASFVTWVVNNPGICWRNVNIVPATLPAFQQAATFSNLDQVAETYLFMVNGTNWPLNTSVNIQCTDVSFGFNYTQVFGDPSQQQNITTIQTVPTLYTGSVMITITPPAGSTVPMTATAQFVFAKYVTSGSDVVLRTHARTASSFGTTGLLGDVQVMRMGECFMLLN